MIYGGLKMKNTSLRIKILSGMLCTGLAFSGANLTFAATKNDGSVSKVTATTSMDFKETANNKKEALAHRAQMKVTLEIVVKESVDLKVITKAEGDKVLEYANTKSLKRGEEHKKFKKEKGVKGGLFNELVTEGILTPEKSDALRKKMYVKNTELRTIEMKKGLNILVVKKVITIEQSNKVEKAITTKQAERKENYKKMKDMSEVERKAYMKKMKITIVSPTKELIENGTITKEQDIEIQKVLPHNNHCHHGHK